MAVRFGILAVAAAAMIAAQVDRAAHAQLSAGPIPSQQHIFLPPSYGATPMSAQLQAEAAYVAGLGDFMVSQSIARRHHAAAAEHEIRNSLLWVQTYFERKEVNRAFYKKYHPDYLDRQAKQQKQTDRRINDLPELVLEGDPTDELNVLLERVAGSTLAHDFLSESNPLVESEFDTPLQSGDTGHILLTDGGKRGAEQLVFRADDAQLFDERWPLALRGPEFDDVREGFEHARDAALGELKDGGKLTKETEQSLFDAVDKLTTAFNDAYPYSRRATSQDFLVYGAGKRYVQSLALGVFRLVETSDSRLFDGSYKFSGSSLVQLVGHLCRFGLEFAPPKPGDEGTYEKLFHGLRRLYLHLEDEEAAEN